MIHGNKIYFFEDLKQAGDTLTIKPRKNQIRVNVYSLKNQLKLYSKEAKTEFENYLVEEQKNGNVLITLKTCAN